MDTELVIRAQRGDEAAFADLTVALGSRLYRIAYGILRDPQLAEDASQQALLKVWRKLPRLRDPAKFEAWSYRFLVRACYDEARRSRRSLPVLTSIREPIAGDDMSAVDDRDQLERGFQRLSMDHRAVIVLHHYLGMSTSEVAEALGIPAGTARSRLDRAMAKLRIALHAEPPAPRAAVQEVAR